VLDLYSSDDFVEMCESLRVLNAVREYRVGLPMSYEQYLRLGSERVISRLTNRHQYLLAIKVSEYLHLPANKIYVHWASQKVKTTSSDDDAICDLIVSRLKGKVGISFASISQAAYDEGRGHLATSLLNSEPRAGKQVPLLLNMEEDEVALDKAIESGDTDLVYFVLLQLKRKLPLASFFRTINNRPLASALVEASARTQDTELLKDLYYQDDRPVEGANLLFQEAMRQTQLQAKLDKLKLAGRLLTDSRDPTAQLHTKTFTEAGQLLKMQEAFDREISDSSGSGSGGAGSGGGGYAGLSVNETMSRLIRSGYSKRAAKVQSEFKVHDKSYWWIRLRALTAARLWGELEDIAKTKKSPIGWEVSSQSTFPSLCLFIYSLSHDPYLPTLIGSSVPFFLSQPFYNETLGAGNTRLASTFVPKCSNLTTAERVEMWVKCGMLVKAGEEALRAKDATALQELRTKATGQQAIEIERLIGQLKPRR
jgi:vacuolar protein sorting-associated protein 16